MLLFIRDSILSIIFSKYLSNGILYLSSKLCSDMFICLIFLLSFILFIKYPLVVIFILKSLLAIFISSFIFGWIKGSPRMWKYK